MTATTSLIVPCYNEAERLTVDVYRQATRDFRGLQLLFVDDGSSDATPSILRNFASETPDRIGVLVLPDNRGKAEAVRLGTLKALENQPDFIGFWDADLATPFDELSAFVELLETHPTLGLVMGARVKLLGRNIRRSALRHYLGRVFATCVSITLDLAVYDTQCGAKLLRADPTMVQHLFGRPFHSSWIFDVEILARLIDFLAEHDGPPIERVVHEHPLVTWRDVEGSKLRPADFARSALELAEIWRIYKPRLRRERTTGGPVQ